MSSVLSRFLCTAALLVWVLPGSAFAQQDGDGDQQQLPEIAPREIEIRGELQLSFPSLKRQPLRGFASPPTIPSVPPAHTPFVAAYKQPLDELPESLPASSTVSESVSSPPPQKQGRLEIGGGRYVSRFVNGRVSLPLTDRQRLFAEANYSGTNGFTAFDQAGIDTPTDDLDGRVGFESRHDGLTVRANLHGAASQYTLYGVPTVAQDTSAEAPDRSAGSAGTAFQLNTHGSVEASVRLSYDYTQYETQFAPPFAATTRDFSEGRFAVDGSVTVPLGGTDALLDFSGSRSTLGGDAASTSSYSIDGGAVFQLLDTKQFSVRAGGRFLGFSSPATPTLPNSPSATASFILPQVHAELTLSPAATVFARNKPGLSAGALSTLYAHNPYAESIPSLRPDVRTTDAEAGLDLSIGPLQFRTQAGYRYAPSYRYFTAPSSRQAADTPFQVEYESARILHGGAELALQGIDGVEASAGVSVRDGRLVGDDDSIPYFSPVVADAMLSISFADQRGLLQTTGTIESPRPVDRTETSEVSTYVSFDLEGSYEVTSLLDVVARIQNIGPEPPKRWARYPQPPATFMAGFRIHW